MREMIVNELTQATQELIREFARFLPRLMVMLIVVLVGWMIAYLVKWILRSILRLIKFDKLSEGAGAAQLLNKAALPSSTELVSRFAFWIAWLGFVLVEYQRSWHPGHAGICHSLLHFPAPPDCCAVLSVLRIAGRQFFLSGRAALGGQYRHALAAAAEFCSSGSDHHLHRIRGFRRTGSGRFHHAAVLRDRDGSGHAWPGHRLRHWRPTPSQKIPGIPFPPRKRKK